MDVEKERYHLLMFWLIGKLFCLFVFFTSFFSERNIDHLINTVPWTKAHTLHIMLSNEYCKTNRFSRACKEADLFKCCDRGNSDLTRSNLSAHYTFLPVNSKRMASTFCVAPGPVFSSTLLSNFNIPKCLYFQ